LRRRRKEVLVQFPDRGENMKLNPPICTQACSVGKKRAGGVARVVVDPRDGEQQRFRMKSLTGSQGKTKGGSVTSKGMLRKVTN